jgi:phosphoribosylaminoimidazolecarboxamide formyltransferase/IMP cyclohydrolase
VSEITGFPAILDGRVKTLHPAIHGGILARRKLPSHLSQLAENHISPIDLVAVNLYPFSETVSREGVSLEEALENIDIGGPTMIRAAAKNFPDVIVVVDPADYDALLQQLMGGGVSLEERKRLAQKAFQHVAIYDTAIASYLREGDFPQELTIALKKGYDLGYGENPHQKAAFYLEAAAPGGRGVGVAAATQLGGKKISFNNILDLDSALSIVSDFAAPTVAVIKHTNPCGLASHPDLAEAYRRALAGDPVAAFGGIVAANRDIDLATAQEIYNTHYDAVIAPAYEAEALALLQRKGELRLLATGALGSSPLLDFRGVKGGFLAQQADYFVDGELTPQPVTQRQPTGEEWPDIIFAWRAVKHVKSNAIVLAREEAILGMGAGQPSRVVSVEVALKKAGERARGGVLASDAFFPFADGVELAGEAGIAAIIQPGGSVRDQEVMAVADKYHMAMVFTGSRHFKH